MDKECKVVLIGNAKVGKSSIIMRYVKDEFDQNIDRTIGSAFFQKKVEYSDTKILWNIWDTAGQERYRSINRLFYQDANVAILVYDQTNVKSFEDLKNFWINEVQSNSPNNCCIVIVSNKSDLEPTVPIEVGQQLADSINKKFYQTSAKDSKGIDEIFFQLSKEVKVKERQSIDLRKENAQERKKGKCCKL